MFSTAATYSYVTVNAYNLWALFPVNGESTASNGLWVPDAPIPDVTSWAQIGPFPAALVGGLLLGLLLFVVVPLLVARKPDRLTILVGVCVLALAFFVVPTRVHERYLYPLFGLAAILFAFSWRWRAVYLVASLATFLNMYVVLTTIYGYMNPNIQDWLGIGEAIRSIWGSPSSRSSTRSCSCSRSCSCGTARGGRWSRSSSGDGWSHPSGRRRRAAGGA